jgi:hypothetical protein
MAERGRANPGLAEGTASCNYIENKISMKGALVEQPSSTEAQVLV